MKINIKEFEEQYKDKTLTTDEFANAMNEVKEATRALEDIEIKTGDDHILLKWGTLKRWDLHSKKGKELLKEYFELGSSPNGCMTQHDTAKQKELICKIIDECNGCLQEDWNGTYLTKEQAKEYVLEYDSK